MDIKAIQRESAKILYGAVNDKDEAVWLEYVDSVPFDLALETLLIGTASYFPMPNAAKYCLIKIFEQEDISRSLKHIYHLTRHFQLVSAAKLIVELGSKNQIIEILKYCLHPNEMSYLFLAIACQFTEDADWDWGGCDWLEKAYTDESKHLEKVIHLLEMRGSRVSDDFRGTLKWFSQINETHLFKNVQTMDLVIDECIAKKLPINRTIPILNHINHFNTVLGRVVALSLNVASPVTQTDASTILPKQLSDEYWVSECGEIYFSKDFPAEILENVLGFIDLSKVRDQDCGQVFEKAPELLMTNCLDRNS